MESAWFKHVSCTLNNLIAINGLYLSVEIENSNQTEQGEKL